MTSPSKGNVASYYPCPPPSPYSFHLLQVTIISAQDLFPAARSSMRTYAIAYVDSEHKSRTCVDRDGHINPSWNDKFLFRVDNATLHSETSSLTVDIYAARSKLLPGSDTLLGTARALLSSLHLSTTSSATQYVALQVRRPNSLRPQGILNIGAALTNAYAKSAPLYDGLDARSDRAKETGPSDADAKVKMVKSKSMKEVEKKLEKWRVELPLVEDKESCEEYKRDKEGKGVAGKGMSRRTTPKMPCFCVDPEGREEWGERRGRVGSS